MAAHDLQSIPDLADHPDVEILRGFDHPHEHLRRRKGVLTAKAWVRANLACFFAEQEGRAHIVLLFQSGNDFRPRFGGEDMRGAAIGSVYELDVFVPERHVPVVDRAERVIAFA
jgi:hypothetical protein